VVLISSKGDWLLYNIRLHFRVTNNVPKYKALINGLHITAEIKVHRLYICNDFELIVNHVMAQSNCRDSHMVAHHQEITKHEEKFDAFELHHILRHDNEATDALTHLGCSHEKPPSGVFVHDLIKPSI
jgi:ribonuclease HI